MTDLFPLWGTGKPRRVAGDMFYGATIARLAPAEFGATAEHVGELRPEPDAEHDPLAVGVYVGGERLAYIPKDHARKLQPRILPFTSRGVAVTVPVAVSRVKDGGYMRVHVVMDEPALLLPVNAPPAAPYRLLDGVEAVAVEDLDADALDAFRRPGGGFSAYGLLDAVEGERVAVLVDGRRVGVLGAVAGGKVREVVAEAADVVACRVEARWSAGSWSVAARVADGALVADPTPVAVVEVLRKSAPAPVEVPVSVAPESAVPSAVAWVFNPPPGWPPSPPGWAPPPGWVPPPHLPPAPAGWSWWRPES